MEPSVDPYDHYPYDPSDFGDFSQPVGGCVECGVMPGGQLPPTHLPYPGV